ncbi:MAG: hypothetical protein U0166_24990 [Acidobacteriota bacterium]
MDIDGYAELLTGAGPSPVFGPHVRGWNYDALGVSPIGRVNFFAYGTLKFGVNVGSGDVDGDGFDEILTGPGPSAAFGAQVRGWNVDGGSVSQLPGLNFDAYAYAYGVLVAAGDVDGIDDAEIATALAPVRAIPGRSQGLTTTEPPSPRWLVTW